MGNTNEMMVEFEAVGENEGFARVVVAAFVSRLNPTLEELGDLKVAVSEAVTNAIIHGYEYLNRGNGEEAPDGMEGRIRVRTTLDGHTVTVQVWDWGRGIPDVSKAMEPLYTTRPEEERSGMGFSFMEAFTDRLMVESVPGEGTCVTMIKVMGVQDGQDD